MRAVKGCEEIVSGDQPAIRHSRESGNPVLQVAFVPGCGAMLAAELRTRSTLVARPSLDGAQDERESTGSQRTGAKRRVMRTPTTLDSISAQNSDGHPSRNGEPRWRDEDGNLYTWDDLHGHVEKFTRLGHHLGALDPTTGKVIKPPVRGRRLET